MANLEKDRIYNFVERISDARTEIEFSEINNRNEPDNENLHEIKQQVAEFEQLLKNDFNATNNNFSDDDIDDTIKKHLRLAGL